MEGIQLSVETGMALGKEQVITVKIRQGIYIHKYLCGYVYLIWCMHWGV